MPTTDKQHTTFQLARLAGCTDPDEHDGIGFDQAPEEPRDGSPGAQFLRSIEYAVDDYLDRRYADQDDAAYEIADSCVPVYTHTLWMTFVDLAAYQEDPTELGADAEDMTKAAGACLYMIGQRLASELIEAASPDEEDDDED